MKMNSLRKLPLVIILGATGSGKTKLSLDLAKRLGGEIIGADSMQIYKNIDIISAKPTKEELASVPHHLIDILEPDEICTVVEYRNRVLPIINVLFNKNKLPIVVGGTNYYIESILWKILVAKESSINEPWKGMNSDLSNEGLYEKLKSLDPIMASKLHPNNRRKIVRALEVIEETGEQLSSIIHEQQSNGGNNYGGGLRYNNAIILWVQWNRAVLNDRINSRVDIMVKDGLLEELENFQDIYNKQQPDLSNPDYTKGIFQMIGFKEFRDYLNLEESEKKTENGQKLLKQGIEDLKMVTRRYANKQCKWIKNRFLSKNNREVPPVYGLKGNTTHWEEEVTNPAIEIIESYINDTSCTHKPLEPFEIEVKSMMTNETYKCDVCNRIFVGEFQWNIHLKSNKHKRRLSSNKNKNNKHKSITEECK